MNSANAAVSVSRQEPDVSARRLRKIIAFDAWAQYAHYFERLVPALEREGLELLLIHIGSWGHDPGRPKEERCGSLVVRDITYYRGATYLDILQREQPSAVLFLSMQPFAHRAFNRYCEQLGIPTVHLYHGIVQVQDASSARLSPLNVRSHLTMALSRLVKNVFRIWPTYARALSDTRASARDWLWFAHVVWRQILGTSYTGVAPPDASTTACCVYTAADVQHAATRYGVPSSAVFPVGNPDLLRFGVTQADLGTCLSQDWAPNREIMYIDTGFIDVGLVYDSAEDFKNHLIDTQAALAVQGFRMLVKLHPAHFRTGMPELLRRHGVETCDTNDFLSRLKQCCACIVEPTTLAVVPGLIGMPLFLAAYGKLASQRYGEVLTSYPRAQHLRDVRLVSRLLTGDQGAVKEMTAQWIELNAGPLPAEEISHRIARVVASLARGCRRPSDAR